MSNQPDVGGGATAMAKAKKSRAPRKEYVPTQEEQEVLDEFASRKPSRSPDLKVGENGLIGLEHPDPVTAAKLLHNALGTSDSTFAVGLMANLLMASRSGGEVSEDRANFFLSIVRGIEPKDPLEAMLAVQMAIIQQTLVEQRPYLLQLQHAGHRADVLAGINKLARTFAMQMDTLKRYRSKGEQKMVVQHVNVSEGGQAIVGDVHQQQKESAVSPSPALTHSKQRPMQPSDERAKQAVSAKPKSTR